MNRPLVYGATVAGAGASATLSLFEPNPVVIALAFPAGALMVWMRWLAAGWRPRRGAVSNEDGAR